MDAETLKAMRNLVVAAENAIRYLDQDYASQAEAYDRVQEAVRVLREMINV